MSEALARFHRTLVDEILRTRPQYLTEPFTVSEIYQHLVPYRTHRDRLGVEMNGDYEDILLRLLAGEGDFIVLESEHARREIEKELESPNPNTGLYREYAAVDVRLNPLRMPRDLPDPIGATASDASAAPGASARGGAPISVDLSPATQGSAPSGAGSTGPAGSDLPPIDLGPLDGPAAPAFDAEPAPSPGASIVAPSPPTPESVASGAAPAARTNCLWCREPLPSRDVLNYCPFCGADMHKAPCPTCGEEVEAGWRFCVVCGTGVEDLL